MSLTAFTPKREDGVAEWRLIYDAIRHLPIGAVITYDELSRILERPFLLNRTPIYRAVKELRHTQSRSMEVVKGQGYRVLHPSEHKDQANSYRHRSRRQLSTGLEVVRSTDVDLLPVAERQIIQAMGMAFGAVAQAMDAIARRQRKTELVLARVVEQTEEHEGRMDRMTDAMRAAGLVSDD